MSDSGRWFRVNCDWWECDWLYTMSAEAQLAWIKFLSRVKTNGYAGRLKKSPTELLARQWMQGEESILQMLKAGMKDGAISDCGDSWAVSGWNKYQGDASNAERQSRFQERKHNADNVLLTDITPTKTKTMTRETPPPKGSPSPSPSASGEPWDSVLFSRLPESHRTDGLKMALCKYARMRSKLRLKAWCDETLSEKVKEWSEHSPEAIEMALMTSVRNGYQGVFPQKMANNGKTIRQVADEAMKHLESMGGGVGR